MNKTQLTYFKPFSFLFFLGLTLFFCFSIIWNISTERSAVEEFARIEAKANFNKDLIYRVWAAGHGGLYVPITETTPPNPFLDSSKHRDIYVPELNKTLTLINPAYMTRQVNEILKEKKDIYGHITSLNPIRPENKPDEWEEKVLKSFESGQLEFHSIETINSREYLRYMHVLKVEQKCLSCHEQQGYKQDDIRGGISISIPMEKYRKVFDVQKRNIYMNHAAIYFPILLISLLVYRKFSGEIHKRFSIQEQLLENELILQTQNKEYLSLYEKFKYQHDQILKTKQDLEQSHQKLQKQNTIIELNNNRLESLLKISQLKTESIQHLLDFSLDEAIALTYSKIGYIYFYQEDKKQFILNTWSKEVMKECTVMNPQTVYDLDKTGCWGEAVRQRKPIIINDYPAEKSIKKGTPQGHVALNRFLTIPVIMDNIIVTVIGVANKEVDYNNEDIRQLTLLMDSVWNIYRRLELITILKEAKNKAEESDRMKTSFLHNISHEIRTPMNAIKGFADILLEDDIPENKRNEFITIIKHNADQLLSIVSNILTISSIESKNEKVTISTINVNKLIAEIVTVFSDNKKPAVELRYKSGINDMEADILTDKTKLNQVLTNLLYNASKFTKEGYIEITCTFSPKDTDPRMLLFEVRDTGIGIDPDKLDIIFERFRQADETIQYEYGGTGLGLSIVKGFVELLGGEIWVSTERGKGSVFSFTLPYNPASHLVVDSKKISKDKNIKNIFAGYTILVAEDEDYNFLVLEEFLSETGISIIHAKNGKEAILLCQESPAVLLVLMDVKMPVMDGVTAAREIKKLFPSLPIIGQSAYSQEHDVKKFSEVFDDYIIKPIKKEVLIEKLTSILKK